METKINKVLLVVNPVSGDIDKQSIIDTVCHYLQPEIELEIYRTSGENDIDQLQNLAKNFEPQRILVAGGDGTIKMTAQACDGLNPVIGILPAGSANGLATDLNIPKDIKKAVVTAMGDATRKVDALKIGDSIGLHISDMGINAELIKKYSENMVRGHFGYFLNSIPTLAQTQAPYTFTIYANGEEREVDAVMIAFANSQKFGTGAVVNPKGSIDDGKFEVLIFKKLDAVEIIKTLSGNIDLDTDFVDTIPTQEVRVKSRQSVAFQIDGEPKGELKEVHVTIYPNYIEIATGI